MNEKEAIEKAIKGINDLFINSIFDSPRLKSILTEFAREINNRYMELRIYVGDLTPQLLEDFDNHYIAKGDLDDRADKTKN